MTGLNDRQLAVLRDAAASLPPEKRSVYLQRVGAMLAIRRHGVRFGDSDVIDCCALAKFGLMQQNTERRHCEPGSESRSRLIPKGGPR